MSPKSEAVTIGKVKTNKSYQMSFARNQIELNRRRKLEEI
jgi:hypothetical protein